MLNQIPLNCKSQQLSTVNGTDPILPDLYVDDQSERRDGDDDDNDNNDDDDNDDDNDDNDDGDDDDGDECGGDTKTT